MTYRELWHRLTPVYESEEAQAVVRILLDELFSMSLTDIVSGKVNELSEENQHLLEEKMQRLEKGEPLQYVLGAASFFGRQFHVTPDVLVPRPETEELCNIIIDDVLERGLPDRPLHILDIGTGSGCIAVTLALEIPGAAVDAWDISEKALAVARENAARLKVNVHFEHQDALATDKLPLPSDTEKYDIIVSNPLRLRQRAD